MNLKSIQQLIIISRNRSGEVVRGKITSLDPIYFVFISLLFKLRKFKLEKEKENKLPI